MSTATIAKKPAERARKPTQFVVPEVDQSLDLRRLLGALHRRKTLIAGIIVLITGLAVVYVNRIVPLYVAEALLVVEGNRQNVVNIESVAQGLTPDYYTNETEAAIISSRGMAGQVADALDLYNSPMFNPLLRTPKAGLSDVAREAIGDVMNRADGGDNAAQDARPDPFAGMSPQERQTAVREMVIANFLSGLTVIPSQRSRVITVQYVSPDAALAARAANATAQAYLAEQRTSKGDVTSRATDWLDKRVVELRARLLESETRLEEFRRESGIVEVRGSNLLHEQVTKLNAELIEARTRRAETAARYAQVQSLLKDENGVESAAAVLDSTLIVRLREQEALLTRKIAELRTQLRDGHPNMILARSELADLQRKIRSEVGKIVLNLGNENEIAKVREQNLEREVATLEAKIGKQNDAEVSLRSLTAEVQANRQLYETVLARFKETKVVDDEIQQADARVISLATVPASPFYPKKTLMIFAAFIASVVVAVAFALLLEMLDTGFRSASQIEAVTGVPSLGAIPTLTKQDRRHHAHEIVIQKPNSAFSEALRSVRTAIMLSGFDEAPKTVLITSAVSGEGKTSLALAMTTLAARSGQRAIIVDCDLRQPSLNAALNHPNEIGLSNYLTGHAALEEVIEIDPVSGVHFICAGIRTPNPTDLLNSIQMRTLLQTLKAQFDVVILDTPPLLAVSDPLVLMRYVDKAVFLVRWEKTRRETAIAALRQLSEAGGDLAGVVLTQVDVRKQARYGYSDSGYQYYRETHIKYYSS